MSLLWITCLLIYLISEEHRNEIDGVESKVIQSTAEMKAAIDNLEKVSETKFSTLAGKSIKC